MSRSSAPSLSSGGETRYTRSQYGKETEEQREPWREPKILTFFSESRNIGARGAAARGSGLPVGQDEKRGDRRGEQKTLEEDNSRSNSRLASIKTS